MNRILGSIGCQLLSNCPINMCPTSVLTSENEFTGAFWGGVPLMREGDFTQEDSHSGHRCSLFCPVDQTWTEVSKWGRAVCQ